MVGNDYVLSLDKALDFIKSTVQVATNGEMDKLDVRHQCECHIAEGAPRREDEPLMYNFKDSMLKAIGEYQVKILVRKKRFKQHSIYI
jgi:hypothetical protein